MKLLSTARDLKRRRARERTGLFTAEGVRTVEELLASPVVLRGALVSPSLAMTPRGAALESVLALRCAGAGATLLEVSDDELASAADTESPQGVIAIGVVPERSFENVAPAAGAPLVVLDGVQDPGNVGTILRTAEAFGACGTVALGGSVDLWNPKVVRSAMGSLFRHAAFHGSVESLLEFRRESGLALWVADGSGDPIGVDGARAPERLAIVVGNEGSGVSSALAGVADRTVAIPVRTVESLNVAVATGILLYALTR